MQKCRHLILNWVYKVFQICAQIEADCENYQNLKPSARRPTSAYTRVHSRQSGNMQLWPTNSFECMSDSLFVYLHIKQFPE